MNDDAIVELQSIALSFGPQDVLRDISLGFRRGQTVVVIGESGCGKTQLLKLIVGLIRPTEGDVKFDGRSLAELSETELTRQRLRIGFLFQQAALFDSLDVFENVAFGLRVRGTFDEPEILRRVGEALREVGLPAGVEAKMPAELSGGMKKRVGLARALVNEPEVMLYDEPTTGLDPIMTDTINGLILAVRARHPITSVVVTHEMRTVRKVADRVVMLGPLSGLAAGESQIVFDGSPEELFASRVPRVRQFVDGDAGPNGTA